MDEACQPTKVQEVKAQERHFSISCLAIVGWVAFGMWKEKGDFQD